MTLIRNEIEYNVISETTGEYLTVSELGQETKVPKTLIRKYNGDCGYFSTKESVQEYWKNKFNLL